MNDKFFLSGDLNQILSETESELMTLRHARIVITGASGFIGRWLSKTLIEANKEFSLGLELLLFGRKTLPILSYENSSKILWKSHNFYESKKALNFGFTHAFHASTPSNVHTGSAEIHKIKGVALNSFESLLDDAELSGNRPNLVHLSSGGVYEDSHNYKIYPVSEFKKIREIDENFNYTSTKLALETKINIATENNVIKGSNPRLFAFYGPHLPTDVHFAIGNFIKNAINGEPIEIKGNSATIRSYMYPVDLVTLLMKILVNPTSSPINVGSVNQMTILDAARRISSVFGDTKLNISKVVENPTSYFPSMLVAEKMYNFKELVTFEDGLERWKTWLEMQPR
jgi:dTDP-glucose 4,6-dehydratase